MGALQRFERRLESLVHRPFAKAFKAEVQPVELASALQRECDQRAAVLRRDRRMVPNVFIVELGDHDYGRLSPYAEPLGAELADMVVEHAEDQQYSFIGPVRVDFEHAEDLATGMFRIRSEAVAGSHEAGPPDAPRPSTARGGGGPAVSDGREDRVGPADAGDPAAPTTAMPAPGGSAYLELRGTRVALAASRTVIGRGADADLRIDDPGVSRRHAEVRVHGGRATITDLGSTNGIVVGGRRVGEVTVGDGDRFTLGSTTFVFRSGGDG